MFVFWYCHKRGKEVRLAAEAEKAGSTDGHDDDDDDSPEDDDEVDDNIAADIEARLNQPQPSEVPLPKDDEEEKKAA